MLYNTSWVEWGPRRVKVETSVSTIISRGVATRCAVRHMWGGVLLRTLMSTVQSSRVFIACIWPFNPLSPHDALKHHFASLKTDLIFPQQRVLERKFP